jgi:hypothetical protein
MRLDQLEFIQNNTPIGVSGGLSSDDLRAFTESQLNFFGNVIMRMDRQVKDLIADTQ